MRIGLTGSFGSGKSAVSRYMEKRGVRVIDADDVAREVTATGSNGLREVIRAFGEAYLREDGSLDRKKMAERVFSRPDQLKKLEAIVHPLVRKREMELLELYKEEDLVVLSAPLLFEKELDKYVDKVIVVTLNDAERHRRIKRNYGMTKEEMGARLRNQMPQEDKVRRADYIIDNNGSIEETMRQVDSLLDTIKPHKGRRE